VDLTWFEAFSSIDRHMLKHADPELLKAWEIFKASPYPHIWGATPHDGAVAVGSLTKNTNQILETVFTRFFGGFDNELLFRYVQATEALARTNEAILELAAAHPSTAAALKQQAESFCGIHGHSLWPTGDCPACIEEQSI